MQQFETVHVALHFTGNRIHHSYFKGQVGPHTSSLHFLPCSQVLNIFLHTVQYLSL
jgi:hypothetical protein